MDYQTISFNIEGHIGVVRLNRPEKLNALNFKMVEEIRDCFARLQDNFNVRVVILGAEGRAFCAGTDVEVLRADNYSDELGRTQFSYHKMQQAVADMAVKMRKAPQPIIAAVHGAAAGGGFALALASDVRIAGESARFNTAFIRVGLSACDVGVSYFLPRLIGLSRASEYMFTGRFMDVSTAERCGLVSAVVKDEKVMEKAFELANEMLQNSPFGLRMTKEVLNMNIDAPGLDSAINLENRTQILCMLTEDCKEAASAFFEKRPAIYKDK